MQSIIRTVIIVVLGLSVLVKLNGGPEADTNSNTKTDALRYDPTSPKSRNQSYVPSPIEKYVVANLGELGFDSSANPNGCTMWKDPKATNETFYQSLQQYSRDLDEYNKAVKDAPSNSNLMDYIEEGDYSICDMLKPHTDGLNALFPSRQLSLSRSGLIEPLTPPLRSHKICQNQRNHLMSLDYLVHDYEAMCRNLKEYSKLVMIDMGASLDFHGGNQPIVTLLNEYEKFGFHFDHIYGFEITKMDPKKVYEELLPEKYFHSYHWINVGVNHEPGHKLNPLHSILQKFNEDDFVVVKLDIDTPSVELPLVRQLMAGGPDKIYHRIVDQFYFEHHVHLGELARDWGTMNGTVKESIEMFQYLREKGIASHYWP